jgi:ribosomal protein S18 acetylase RimI-like enzyme
MKQDSGDHERFNPEGEQKNFGGEIRPLQARDLEEIKPILETWLKSRDTGEPLPDEVTETIDKMQISVEGGNDRVYLVAEDEGNVIGIIGYKLPDNVMNGFARTKNPTELINAYVLPGQTGRRVGKTLVEKLEEMAKLNNFTEIIINSGPRYKKTSWNFYDNLPGYQRVGVAEKYYGEGGDAPVWSKILERELL